MPSRNLLTSISTSLALLAGIWAGANGCSDEHDPAEPVDCDMYRFEEGSDWWFAFTNNRAEPVYLEIDCRGLPVQISDAQAQAVHLSGLSCDCFCHALLNPGVADCFECTAECLDYSSVVHIGPGATWNFYASGMMLDPTPALMSAECVDDPVEVGAECVMLRQLPGGSYTLRATISSTLDCAGANACDCTPDEEGGCATTGALGERVALEISANFPSVATFSIN